MKRFPLHPWILLLAIYSAMSLLLLKSGLFNEYLALEAWGLISWPSSRIFGAESDAFVIYAYAMMQWLIAGLGITVLLWMKRRGPGKKSPSSRQQEK